MNAKNSYSPERAAAIRRRFAGAAARHRWINIFSAVGGVLLLAVLFAAIGLAPAGYAVTVGIVGVAVFLAVLLAANRFFPALECPGCSKPAVGVFGSFCPVCGGYGMRDVTRGPGCAAEYLSCKRRLSYSRYATRAFKIRFCTGCGVDLTGGRGF